jgi:hypothetical protein
MTNAMTNAAQPVTTLTNHHRPVLHGDTPARRVLRAPALDDNLLSLTGGVPQTINVSVIAGVPFFSRPTDPEQLYTGIKWQTNGYALMITFAFLQPPPSSTAAESITELSPVTPALWFSDTFPSSGLPSQMCCVPSILGEYHFNVVLGDGSMVVDPKVVVIPIIT